MILQDGQREFNIFFPDNSTFTKKKYFGYFRSQISKYLTQENVRNLAVMRFLRF